MPRWRSLRLAAAAWYGVSVAAADLNPAQRQQIETIIHDYLMQHPEVLVAALREAEDKLDHDDDAKASQAVAPPEGDLQ